MTATTCFQKQRYSSPSEYDPIPTWVNGRRFIGFGGRNMSSKWLIVLKVTMWLLSCLQNRKWISNHTWPFYPTSFFLCFDTALKVSQCTTDLKGFAAQSPLPLSCEDCPPSMAKSLFLFQLRIKLSFIKISSQVEHSSLETRSKLCAQREQIHGASIPHQHCLSLFSTHFEKPISLFWHFRQIQETSWRN